MKKIMMFVGVLSAMWTTNSDAQFQDQIKKNILVTLGDSNMQVLDGEQLRFIVQDAVDNAVAEVLEKGNKLALVNFLHESYVTTAQNNHYFRTIFSPNFKGSPGYVVEATEKLKSYFTKSEWREKIIGGLNKQIGNAIVYAYQNGVGEERLSLAAGNAFLEVANDYLDNTVPMKKALLNVDDLMVFRVPMNSNTLVARTTSNRADDFLQMILKLF